MDIIALYGEPGREGKTSGRLAIHYVDIGEVSQPAVVLVMGLACQLTTWPASLVRTLRKRGLRVVLFDNRDIGLSDGVQQRVALSQPMAFLRYKFGMKIPSPYTLFDMADDVVSLLNHLDLQSVHLVGVSMGGMISQILCARHSHRVETASLIMTSDNHPANQRPSLRVLWHLNGGGIKGHTLDASVRRSMNFWRAIQSPDYPVNEDEQEKFFAQAFQRSYRPAGILRQLNAIMATGSLRGLLGNIQLPVQIIHGDADPLVPVSCGKNLHKRIRNSGLEIIKGMGHDLPEVLGPKLGVYIAEHAQQH